MVTTRYKLELIAGRLGLTQTKLAERLRVSFPTLNSWWNGRSAPRAHNRAAIDELYLEITGQKMISREALKKKKDALRARARLHGNIFKEILDNPDIRDEFVLKLTYNSNRIEGSTLSEPDTAAVLFDNVALPNKSLIEQLEAKNHQTALLYLFGHLSLKKSVNEAFVLKLSSILMNGIRSDAGVYRNHRVRIAGVNLPTANHASVPRRMLDVMKKAAHKTQDAIACAAEVHSRFEQIHPFSDGNGRVGRLLMNAMLLRGGFAPAVIRQEQKQLYYTYLYKAQTNGDHSQLEDFLCNTVMDGFKILERKGAADL